MNEFLILAVALAAGLLLGAFFFGGLWWTVRKGASSLDSILPGAEIGSGWWRVSWDLSSRDSA